MHVSDPKTAQLLLYELVLSSKKVAIAECIRFIQNDFILLLFL